MGYSGNFSVANALLDNTSFHSIFSPKSTSLLYIECVTLIEPIGKPLDANIDTLLEDFDKSGLLVLKNTCETGIADIQQFLPIFKDIFTDKRVLDDNQLDGFTLVSEASLNDYNVLEISQAWSNVSNFISESTTKSTSICITGGRNVGKSTFAQITVNNLLKTWKQVAYLDCDINKPEFTMSGIVSLVLLDKPILGPSFTHQIIDLKDSCSFYLGSTSSLKDPDAYLEAIIRLHEYWKTNHADTPLIINTMGWIKGLGFDLLTHFINIVDPSFVLCLEPPPNTDQSLFAGIALSYELSTFCKSRILSVESILDKTSRIKFNANEYRILSTIGYFHKKKEFKWDFNVPISFELPYKVNWDTSISIVFMHAKINPKESLYALNGTIIALLKSSVKLQSNSILNIQDRIPIGSRLIGMGIIQSIKQNNKTIEFYIQSPISLEQIQDVDLIARGAGVELPLCLAVHGYGIGGPYTSGSSCEGHGSMAPRNRHNLLRAHNNFKPWSISHTIKEARFPYLLHQS